ncbi:MAG: hypothetical protein Tsb0024_13150 [Ruegeria sp.]
MQKWGNEVTNLDAQVEQPRQWLRDRWVKAQTQKRRYATRRKIISGATVLKPVEETEGDKADRLQKLFHERITRDSDREFIRL